MKILMLAPIAFASFLFSFAQPGDAASPAKVTTVAVGGSDTCAIKDSKLSCWGKHYQAAYPVPVDLATGITTVALGEDDACVIKSGKVYCWGGSSDGALYTPAGMTSGVTAISVGAVEACAVKNGALYCWALRDWNPQPTHKPTLRTSRVKSLSAGPGVLCAILTNGSLWCQGPGGGNPTPSGLNSNVTAVSIASFRNPDGSVPTCAIKGGRLYCWDFEGKWTLRKPLGAAKGFSAVSVNRYSACTIKSGALSCNEIWADGTFHPLEIPAALELNSGVTAIDARGDHFCAIKKGALYCWGEAAFRQSIVPPGLNETGNCSRAVSAQERITFASWINNLDINYTLIGGGGGGGVGGCEQNRCVGGGGGGAVVSGRLTVKGNDKLQAYVGGGGGGGAGNNNQPAGGGSGGGGYFGGGGGGNGFFGGAGGGGSTAIILNNTSPIIAAGGVGGVANVGGDKGEGGQGGTNAGGAGGAGGSSSGVNTAGTGGTGTQGCRGGGAGGPGNGAGLGGTCGARGEGIAESRKCGKYPGPFGGYAEGNGCGGYNNGGGGGAGSIVLNYKADNCAAFIHTAPDNYHTRELKVEAAKAPAPTEY